MLLKRLAAIKAACRKTTVVFYGARALLVLTNAIAPEPLPNAACRRHARLANFAHSDARRPSAQRGRFSEQASSQSILQAAGVPIGKLAGFLRHGICLIRAIASVSLFGLLETGGGGPVIVGSADDSDVLRLENLLARNGHPLLRLDPKSDTEAMALIGAVPCRASQLAYRSLPRRPAPAKSD